MFFKSAQEVMEALLAGKKVRHEMWEKGDYIHIKDGKLLANDGEEVLSFQPNCYHSWEEYVESPKKKKLYRLTNFDEVYIVSSSSKKEARKVLFNYLITTFDDLIEEAKNVLSIKYTKCERVYYKNNVVISTSECYIDPTEILE